MVGTIDCAIIVTAHRMNLVREQVLPSVLAQGFFQSVFVVGDFMAGNGYRYLSIPDVTSTTLDALMKRECASAVSSADWLLYLCDDHMLLDRWADGWLRTPSAIDVGIMVPDRFAERDGRLERINNGTDHRDPNAPYCGGHAGMYRRDLLRRCPWMTAPHNKFWDLYHSRQALLAGFRVETAPLLRVRDIDPSPVEQARHFAFPASP